MQSLDCTIKKLEGHSITLVELVGEIDSSEALDSVRTILSGDNPEHVAIMMAGVTYINSSGCGGLIELHRAAEVRGCRLFIVEPVGSVAKVLKEIGCDRILHVVDSLQDVTSLAGSTVP